MTRIKYMIPLPKMLMRTFQTEFDRGSILIVDDTPVNLRLLSEILAKEGYEVRPTPKGEHALLSARSAAPDLILLDIKMPGLDGYAVCEALKADARTREIPVIFISALNEALDKVKAFAAGGVDYITKPFQAEEVLARVATHLALHHLQKRLQEKNAQLQQEIAERKRVEQELVKHREHLEELVVKRTHDLQKSNDQLRAKNLALQESQAALQQAQKEAETANHAKSEFIANISHEIRTPLNIMLGYAQLLRHDDNLTAEQQETLQTIQQSGDHLLLMLDDILDLATIAADKLRLEMPGFVFPHFLAKIANMARIQANLQGLAFHFEAAPDLPGFVVADEKRLRQVLLNLLGNAVKFTPHGKVTFRVGTPPAPPQGGNFAPAQSPLEGRAVKFYPLNPPQAGEAESFNPPQAGEADSFNPPQAGEADSFPPACGGNTRGVAGDTDSELNSPALEGGRGVFRFEVEDTGIGIPPEQLEKIFTAFHQVESKWSAQTDGIGLGLTVSQRLARLMGSELHVRSAPGAGSLFWFDLALPETPPTEPYADLLADAAEAQADASQPPLNVPPLLLPRSEDLTLLLNLALDGDIEALQEQAQSLARLDPALTAFTAKLAEFVKTFQIGKIQDFLRECLAR